jgi:transposase
MLMSQGALSLIERAEELRFKYGVTVSPDYLRKLYIRRGIRFRRVDLHNVNKMKKQEEIK